MFDYTLTLIKNNPEWVAIFLFTIFEAWLGRTDKVKSNSTLDVIFRVLFKNRLIRILVTALYKAFSRRK